MVAAVPPATSHATLAHRAQYMALRGLIAGLSALPMTAASAIGARLARLGRWPLGIRRRVVERQLAAAFPNLSADQVRNLARRSYEHLGRLTVETALLPSLGQQGVLDLFDGADGWELVDEAMQAGRGLLFVTGHLGNWELAGAYVAARGVPLDVVARRMGNPLFDGYLTRTRERVGMSVVYDSDAVRRLTRTIRDGRAAALLADQGVKNLSSTFVPFFGRPARTPRGPAVFAIRWDAPMLFAAALRQRSGRYRFCLEKLEVSRTGDRERDVDATVAHYTAVLEQWVRRYPEQYFWQHRRWKRQPPDTPRELRDPSR